MLRVHLAWNVIVGAVAVKIFSSTPRLTAIFFRFCSSLNYLSAATTYLLGFLNFTFKSSRVVNLMPVDLKH
jgi:hypothetical protein